MSDRDNDIYEIKLRWWPERVYRAVDVAPTDPHTVKLHMRDLSKDCPRCTSVAGADCQRLVLYGDGLRFVFPCGTTREEVEEVKRLTAERLREMQGGER